MDYYKRKYQAMNYIDNCIKIGSLSKEDIEFSVLQKYQFGKKFVQDYIGQLINRGFAQLDDGYIISTKVNKDE